MLFSIEAGQVAVLLIQQDLSVLHTYRYILKAQDTLDVQNVIHIIGHTVRIIRIRYAERYSIAVGTAGQ